MADSRYLSKELITNFIEVYKSYPCLWKVKCKEYTNKNLKNIAYDKLVEVCKTVYPEANRDYVVKKIQSFRGSFRKEMKKVLESKRSGAGEQDVYVPTLWYYDLLLFTVDQEIPTGSISNMDTEKMETVDENEGGRAEGNEGEKLEREGGETQESVVEENSQESSLENSLLSQVLAGTSNASTPKSMTLNSKIMSTNSIGRQKGKRAVSKRNLDFIEYCKKQLDAKTDIDIDEYDAVGISWGKKFKRMDPMQAIYAEALVNKVITQGLLKKLTDTTTVSDEDGQRSTPLSSFSQYTMSNSSARQLQYTAPMVPERQVETSSMQYVSPLATFYQTASNIDSDIFHTHNTN